MKNQRARVTIRLFAGVYLGYISYNLLFGEDSVAMQYPLILIAGIFFMAMAILIVAWSAKELKDIREADLNGDNTSPEEEDAQGEIAESDAETEEKTENFVTEESSLEGETEEAADE